MNWSNDAVKRSKTEVCHPYRPSQRCPKPRLQLSSVLAIFVLDLHLPLCHNLPISPSRVSHGLIWHDSRCTALDHPFLLLPFRPTSDPSAVRTFIRHFFENHGLRGEVLAQELRMTEPMVGPPRIAPELLC